MYCSSCGGEIAEGVNYCTSCGAPASAQARLKQEVARSTGSGQPSAAGQTMPEGPIKAWFNLKSIRDQGQLTSEQIAYLKKGSVTVFGPFNVFVRRH